MKKIKKILIALASLALLLLVCSCAQIQTSLDTPQGLIVSDEVLHWQSVDGASAYIVMVNSIEQPRVTSTQLDLSTIGLKNGDVCTIQVKALGDGYIYLNSEYSFPISHTYTVNPPDENNGGGSIGGNDGNTSGDNTGGGNASDDNGGSSSGTGSETNSSYIKVENGDGNVFIRDVEFYIPHSAGTVKIKDQCTDGKYNYYLYHLGYMENFPLLISESIQYYKGSPLTGMEYSVNKEENRTIQNTLTTHIDVTASISQKLNVGMGLDFGFIGANFEVENQWSASVTNGRETSESVANSWAESTSSNIELTFSENTKEGWYRYVKYTKNCDIYVLAIYDIEANKGKDEKSFTYSYLTFSDPKVYTMFEYSLTDNFNSNNEKTLKFDENILANIDVNAELEYRGLESEVPITAIVIEENKHLCKKDNDYKTDSTGEDRSGVLESMSIGHLEIFGCIADGSNYVIKDFENFEIQYVFDENPDDLPWKNDLHICSDNAKTVDGTDIKGEKIGRGAYQIKFKNKQGKVISETIKKTNFMDGQSKNSHVTMLSSDILPSGCDMSEIAQIEITIVFEVKAYLGWNIANIGSDDYTNWRCDYVFNFN